MFTVESIINTVETAKLNALEKLQINKTLKENLKAAVRAEAQFANTVVATSKNIANEVVNFKYVEAIKPVTAKFEEFFKTKK